MRYMDYENNAQRLRARGVRAEVCRTYRELLEIRDEFVMGNNGFSLPFLVVIGPPGLSKSHHFERMPGAYYANNAASAVGLYALAYRNADKPLILDDIDDLLKDRAAVSVLKALANDRAIKTVCWEKQNAALEVAGIPNRFQTTSRLCILANEFPRVTWNVQAVFDRAKTVFFLPSAQEVHAYVGSWWPTDQRDIHVFLGQHLSRLNCPSIRWYTDALREKNLGNDWKGWLLRQLGERDFLVSIAGEILQCTPAGEQRVQEWVRRTGLGRSWFYACQRAYLAAQKTSGLVD